MLKNIIKLKYHEKINVLRRDTVIFLALSLIIAGGQDKDKT